MRCYHDIKKGHRTGRDGMLFTIGHKKANKEKKRRIRQKYRNVIIVGNFEKFKYRIYL